MKKVVLISIVLLTFIIGVYAYYYSDKQKYVLKDEIGNQVINTNSLTMMYETEYQSGEYQISSDSAWPQSGYTFYEELSKCENGSTLTWDDENKKVLMQANTSDKCYVYFDKEPETLANYIINNVYTGIDGKNDLYHHDGVGSYINADQEAGDNSYRYSGANPNNFVCFGSDDEICPEDNLYRIIGVFNNNVKVVKATSYGEYQSSNYNVTSFSETEAYTALNETFYNSLDVTWQNMIINYYWISSDIQYSSYTYNTSSLNSNYDVTFLVGAPEQPSSNGWGDSVKNFYLAEINAEHDLLMFIGTFSASELKYASTPENWNMNFLDIDTTWLFNENNEATYLYSAFYFQGANTRNYIISDNGELYFNSSMCVNCDFFPTVVRPCFYLDNDVMFVSGVGSQENPFRIG